MNRKVPVLLVVSLLIFSLDLPAKNRRGAELVVTKNDGQTLKGELVAVKENSVLLLSPEGADVSADIKDINMIIIKTGKKPKVEKGFIIGLLAGAATGALLGQFLPWDDPDASELAVPWGAAMFGAVGALTGVLIGAASSPYKTIKIKEKSDAETKKIMEKLRRQARLPNAQ